MCVSFPRVRPFSNVAQPNFYSKLAEQAERWHDMAEAAGRIATLGVALTPTEQQLLQTANTKIIGIDSLLLPLCSFVVSPGLCSARDEVGR
jgi:hypothetical protein